MKSCITVSLVKNIFFRAKGFFWALVPWWEHFALWIITWLLHRIFSIPISNFLMWFGWAENAPFLVGSQEKQQSDREDNHDAMMKVKHSCAVLNLALAFSVVFWKKNLIHRNRKVSFFPSFFLSCLFLTFFSFKFSFSLQFLSISL